MHFNQEWQWCFLDMSEMSASRSFVKNQIISPGVKFCTSRVILQLNLSFGWEFWTWLLFCIQHPPWLVSFWCMLRGSVEVWAKNILYQFIEGQTHFGMPRGAKMSLALNEPKQVSLHSNSNSTSKHAPQAEINYWYCMQNNNWKFIGDPIPYENSHLAKR